MLNKIRFLINPHAFQYVGGVMGETIYNKGTRQEFTKTGFHLLYLATNGARFSKFIGDSGTSEFAEMQAKRVKVWLKGGPLPAIHPELMPPDVRIKEEKQLPNFEERAVNAIRAAQHAIDELASIPESIARPIAIFYEDLCVLEEVYSKTPDIFRRYRTLTGIHLPMISRNLKDLVEKLNSGQSNAKIELAKSNVLNSLNVTRSVLEEISEGDADELLSSARATISQIKAHGGNLLPLAQEA